VEIFAGGYMKKICVITTSRADYGYLFWIMKDIEASDKLELQIAYPYTHQCQKEIWNTFTNYNNHAVLGDMNGIYDIGQFFNRCLEAYGILKPDMVLVLGDRFEVHSAATAALLLNIPIAHLHGGECTTGAFDNEIRNAITMMATYHFTATKEYAEKVGLMLGIKPFINYLETNPYLPNPCVWDWCESYDMWYSVESYRGYYPDTHINIFNVGSTAIDWLRRAKLLSKQELQQYVSIDLNQPFVVACFHPETKELPETERHVDEFMKALEQCSEQILLNGSNIDPGNGIIHERIWRKHCDGKEIFRVSNLDHLVYLSLLQYASLMVGNSSSGIIESASFDLPSVCVGNRQAGRIRGSNVFDCPCETEAILTAIDRAREWNATIGKCENPYGSGHSSEKIVEILEELLC
jgi:GDP/UDP-N,N'-diacetylbacillosamine 2-epimerase (hydrolysing)